MENFNTVPDKGTFGGSVEVINQNFSLAQQEMEVLQNKCENESARAIEAENSLRQLYNNIQQSKAIPVTQLPATGEAGKIYRLAGTTSYADYMYSENDLTTPIKMAEYNNAIDDEPTAGSNNLVKSGGVYTATLGGFYIPGFNYFGDNTGVITPFHTWFRVSKLMIVEEGVDIKNTTSPNTAAACCVVYDEDLNIVKQIVATTPSTQSGSFVKDISYEDIKDGKYFRWCNDERNPVNIVGTLSNSQKNSENELKTNFAFENSTAIFAGSLHTCLTIDITNGIIKTNNLYIINGGNPILISSQEITVEFPSTLELYVVYINKESELKCVKWNQFDYTDSMIVVCRFTIDRTAAHVHNESFRIDYACCEVQINGQRRDIDSVGSELHNIKYYDSNGNCDFGYFEQGGIYTKWDYLFKCSKYFKVEDGVEVLNCVSPNNAVPCCVVYDENFNVIKTIIATTASPFSGAFLKDITYADISVGKYFRWCCDLRTPSVVVGDIHEADEKPPVFDSSDLMESELGGTDLSYYNTIGHNNYNEAQEMEVYGLRAILNSAIDTNILLINAITHSTQIVYTIKADAFAGNKYVYIKLPKPIHIKANQYLGFSTNVKYRSNASNTFKGARFIDNSGGWVNYSGIVFSYGIYVKSIKEKQIKKTISVLTDSLGTDDYVSLPKRNYWKSLIAHSGMTLYRASTVGGTCIMQGLRSSGVSFTDQSRWGALFSNGTTGNIPDIILVQGGVNDFGTSPADSNFVKYAEIGSMADSPSPTTSFYSAYKYLLQNLCATYPNAQIVCCTPPKMFDTPRLSSVQPLVNKHNLKMSQFVDAIKEVAAEYGAVVVDLFSELPITKDNRTLYMADTFHPKDEGCALMERILLEKLISIS